MIRLLKGRSKSREGWIGAGLFIALVCMLALADSAAQTDRVSEGRSHIVLLGTGTPNADPDRSGPCVAVVVNDTPYLVDCGPGLVRRAADAHRSGVGALDVGNLTRLFVTHLHSDHTAGFADLILTPAVHGRRERLQVYGPEGIRKMTEHILAAYEQDIYMRLYGLERGDPESYRVDVHEIQAGIVYQDSNVTVEAFPVVHGSWPVAFGYKFYCPDRTIVISGDTRPCDSLIQHAAGCDVLIHEVYSVVGFKKRSGHWQTYHSSFHTSADELAEIASIVKPGLLVLYHQLHWGASDEELVDEVTQGYDGRVVSGRDLGIY
jgi:ribonuclease BN (tRNA processing enzyme)